MKKFKVTLGVCLIVLGVVLLCGVLVSFILPVQYGSTARIRIEKPSPPDTVYLQTEIEVIRSTPVLNQVIKNLNLGHVFAQKYKEPVDFKEDISLAILKSRLDIHLSRSTSLIDIKVVSEDRDEAATIANEIGKIYCETANRTAREIGVTLKASVLDSAAPAYRPVRNAPLKAGFYGVGGIICIVTGVLRLVRSGRPRTIPPPLHHPPR